MRRVIFLILGLLELSVGVVLLTLGAQLPDHDEVQQGFQGAERVTQNAGTQARIMRRQVQDLRRPELQQVASRLQKQTHSVTALLNEQKIDYKAVRSMRDALDEAAVSLDALSSGLDGSNLRKLGEGLGDAAGLIEERLIPGTAKTAEQVEAATQQMRGDAKQLAEIMRASPLDLKTAREVHESLVRFGEGLDRMGSFLKLERLDTMRDGFRGLDTALGTGAEQVERLSGYTYPVVTMQGIRPEVEQRKFWPEGDKIAEGLRKAQTGVAAAGKELDGINGDLPKLRTAVDESRKVVRKTREALAAALEQQSKLEPVLKDWPERAARLAETLPRIGDDIARLLRDTSRLTELAKSLRQVQKGVNTAVERWPELQAALAHSASLLRTMRTQLDLALTHRQDYEKALNQSTALAESFAVLLPLMTDQLDSRLDEEENALQDMEQSLGEVQKTLPVYERTTQHVIQAGRILSWLMAALAAVHGVYLMLSVRLGRRYSL